MRVALGAQGELSLRQKKKKKTGTKESKRIIVTGYLNFLSLVGYHVPEVLDT